ncbi:MAG: hydroxyacylglutathione hydrolase [Roseibaca calidilacus]|uniref:Glyoxylase, beta-lactamase superfamily II n=1 Tax=Roseibaca calidilacus TaxID=1666912 RepID=A0A0P8AEX8_9RHOB|nr:MBL fold metallo-hydrolase [Roseibaca calidilacus]KPP92803.1 MAG: hydroxyacylglutathione hydrolase [Roseibaca calidilacus]CUX80125.1 Glyoxylase, beta-lactamase superfamily II [Roseibaca calidilacus]
MVWVKPYMLYSATASEYFRQMMPATFIDRDLALIRAENPSPMTAEGTNSYILGTTELAVIDPGPDDPAHLARLLDVIDGRRVAAILVTHSHMDHSPLAPRLSNATGAPVLAYGDSHAGRSAQMTALAAQLDIGGGEGVDLGFAPHDTLQDGQILPLGADTITAIWTPGHMGNHMCFLWRDHLFTGDHVMGWAPSLVSPPDGDMQAYMASLARLQGVAARLYHPGHGAIIDRPAARIAELVAHRVARERAILQELDKAPADITSLVTRIYAGTPAALHKAAARNVFAHLADLHARAEVAATPKLCPEASFARMQTR